MNSIRNIGKWCVRDWSDRRPADRATIIVGWHAVIAVILLTVTPSLGLSQTMEAVIYNGVGTAIIIGGIKTVWTLEKYDDVEHWEAHVAGVDHDEWQEMLADGVYK